MFKKSPNTKQFDLFCSPSGLMCERESRFYDDEAAWHNKFFRNVTLTEDAAKTVHADGAYQSTGNREFAADNNIDLVTNGIQGKPSRFDLSLSDGHTLEVTDKTTAEVQTAILVKEGKWKIPLTGADGKTKWRYFSLEHVEKSEARRKTESIPFEERKKRNNVEATIFQYCFHTRNNKTRYRTLIKHTMQAIARCAWINMRRLFLFEAGLSLQMAK